MARQVATGRALARVAFSGLLALFVLTGLVAALALHTGERRLTLASGVCVLVAGSLAAYALMALRRLSALEREAAEKARIDPVTGVFNLEHLKGVLRKEHAEALRTATTACVLYVDMVKLDAVNQEFGYTTGDIVLKAMAQRIASSAREGDIIGHVAGDEFLVIMPGCSAAQAEPITDAVRGSISSYHLDLGSRGTIDYLSCKVGLAVAPTDGNSPEAIIAAARGKMT